MCPAMNDDFLGYLGFGREHDRVRASVERARVGRALRDRRCLVAERWRREAGSVAAEP
jgi:hypothetical protein